MGLMEKEFKQMQYCAENDTKALSFVLWSIIDSS